MRIPDAPGEERGGFQRWYFNIEIIDCKLGTSTALKNCLKLPNGRQRSRNLDSLDARPLGTMISLKSKARRIARIV